ncbi:MAG: M16 family metallopeptidase, partial [Isosphaeraceae bacterium]
MNGKHRIVLALSLGWLLLTAGSTALSAEPGQTKVADKSAILISSPSSPLVSFRFVFRVGSQDDPSGKEGLAALTTAMIAEGGTASLSYEQLLEKFYPMAATLDGACRKEATAFQGTVHRDNLKAYIPLVTELLTAPRFAPDDFERLRNEALDYVTKTLRGNNDEELGKWTLQCDLYKGHPYGHPDRGTVQGLKAITLDDVKAFHKRYYTRGALTLGMAGGFEPAAASQVESNLASLPRQAQGLPPLDPPAVRPGLEVTIVAKPAEATAISIGFPIDVTRR